MDQYGNMVDLSGITQWGGLTSGKSMPSSAIDQIIKSQLSAAETRRRATVAEANKVAYQNAILNQGQQALDLKKEAQTETTYKDIGSGVTQGALLYGIGDKLGWWGDKAGPAPISKAPTTASGVDTNIPTTINPADPVKDVVNPADSLSPDSLNTELSATGTTGNQTGMIADAGTSMNDLSSGVAQLTGKSATGVVATEAAPPALTTIPDYTGPADVGGVSDIPANVAAENSAEMATADAATAATAESGKGAVAAVPEIVEEVGPEVVMAA